MNTTDALDIRIPLADLRVGDLLVIANRVRVDSTVTAVETLPAGHIVVGPRGGLYRLRRPQTVVRTLSKYSPVLEPDSTVTVYRSTEGTTAS